ncbi:hypothetical protein AX17_007310 [Amanita inopinata Kibby_2008]|nr:hypothetical protein AX17_007310 [Amanita inopinata Kibby_2008]
MVPHRVSWHRKKRQTSPTSVPDVSGIDQNSVLVVDPSDATNAFTLALDTTAPAGAIQSAPPLAGTYTPIVTSTEDAVASATSDPAPLDTSTPSAVGATHTLPLKTVIGSCLGAFAGAVFLILIAFWLYKRYVLSLKGLAARGGVPGSRNSIGDAQRRRSRLEAWSKLEEDRWDNMETKEAENVAPMERLTMFKKSPSIRTAYTHKSDERMIFDLPLSLAQYHPELAKRNASKPTMEVAVHRPFIGRAESGPTISWDSDTLAESSIMSVASNNHPASSAGNKVASIAIPTPAATYSTLHRWESAEVINPVDSQTAIPNPFETEAERGRAENNPFFKGQDYPSINSRIRTNSISTIRKPSKGKARELMTTHFGNEAQPPPRPYFVHHVTSPSNQQAIESLIAALGVSEQEDARFRASMQPSIVSTAASAYITGGDDAPRGVAFSHPGYV